MRQRGVTLTQIISNFVGAIRKNPEEDSFGAADRLASFIHPGRDKRAAGFHSLHEDVTRDRHVLPVTHTHLDVIKVLLSQNHRHRQHGSPLIVSDDANGLVGVRRPGDRSLHHDLSKGEDVRPGVGEVHVVLEHARLVGEVWSL